MRLKSKLAGGFAIVALLGLLVAGVGFWQVRLLSRSLYEVGVVRLPSLEGLHMMGEARSALDESLRSLAAGRADAATLADLRRRQEAMWELAARGRALYEPLPQTPEEAREWQTLVPVWDQWRTECEALTAEATPEGIDAKSSALRQISARVDRLLTALIALNRERAEDTRRQSISSEHDIRVVERIMVVAAIGALVVAVVAGWFIGRAIARPAERAVDALDRTGDGPWPGAVPVESSDEVGAMAGALNRMVEAVRTSEKRLQAVADHLPNGMVYQLVRAKNGTMRFAYVSAGIERVNGLTAEAVRREPRRFFDQVVEEDRSRLLAARQRSYEKGENSNEVIRMRRADGEVRWVQFCSAPRRNPDGTCVWDGVALDVTERQNAIDALRRSERELRRIFDNAPICIALIKDRRYVRVNACQCRLSGYTEQEMLAMNLRQIYFSDEEFERVGREFYDMLGRDGAASGTVTCRRKDGEAVHLYSRLVPMDRTNPDAGVIVLSLDVTEQRRLEGALHHRERELAALLEAAPVGIFLVKQRRFLRVNRMMGALFGQPLEAFAGADTRMIYAGEEEYQRVGRELRAALADATHSATLARGRRRDGSEFDFLIQASPFDPADLSAGLVGMVLDVTERQRAEAALRAGEARLQEIFDHTTEIIFVVQVGADGRFTYQSVNRAVERIGLSVADFAAGTKTPAEIFERSTAARFEQNYRDCVAARQPIVVEQQLLLPQGRVHTTATLVPVVDEAANRVVRIVGFARDTTQRKQAEEALRASEEKYRGIVENAIEGFFQSTPDGRLLSANPALARLHGYATPEEMIADVSDLGLQFQVRKECREELARRLLEQGTVRNFECEIRRRDGERVWLSINAHVARDAAGRRYFEGTQVDITAQRRAAALEAANARAEAASRAKSAFLANMSHEIRTPMNAILGFAQLLMRDPELTPAQRQHLRTIGSNGEHLMSLINDVLEMSKIEANRATLHLAPFEVEALARDLESMFRARVEAKGLALRVVLAEAESRWLEGDRGKLRQIFVNLLSNALKFTASGRIELRLRCDGAEGGHVRLIGEVEDTGSGVAADDLGPIFNTFEQTELGRRIGAGTGLGLPISREFARMMDGDVTATSAPGRGSIFRVEVRLKPAAEVPAAARLREEPLAAGQVWRLGAGGPEMRVLVADDLRDSRQFLLELLTGSGFSVREAADGREAVEATARWQPHAILMDLRMPVMDGLEAIREIRRTEKGRRIRIIALTASVFAEDRDGVRAAGADSFLVKPVRITDLLRELGRLLELRFETIGPSARDAAAAPPLPGADGSVPPEFTARMREAVAAADLDHVLALASGIASTAPALAARLTGLANNFDYEELVRVLDSLAPPPS